MWLGIDFGTCLSSAALLKDGVPTPLTFGANLTSLPSSVYVDEGGKVLVGDAAERKCRVDPTRYRREFKRDLGSRTPYRLGGQEWLPEQLVVAVLHRIRSEAETQWPERDVGWSAVLTVPANYRAPKRELMRQAASEAGFEAVELLDEPAAAAIYYARQSGASAGMAEGEVILVYDLGGGTFDASLIQRHGTGYEPLALSVGHERLGGVDFDRLIYQDLLQRCSGKVRALLLGEDEDELDEEARLAHLVNRLWMIDECRALKHHLSEDEEAVLRLPQAPRERYQITRAVFNAMIAPAIDETCELCRQLVKSAGLDWTQVARVLLVGGSCRMPYVREAVEVAFQRPVFRVDAPELAVCMGAAIHGAVYLDEAARLPRGKDIEQEVEISFEEALHGTTAQVSVTRSDGSAEPLEVNIPPGIDTGTKVRLAGKGKSGTSGGVAGDLYLVIRVRPHAFLVRQGSDIVCEVSVTPEQAMSGTKLDIPTIDGQVRLTLPAGTLNGQRFRLPGKGLALVEGEGRGDQYVTVRVNSPETPTSAHVFVDGICPRCGCSQSAVERFGWACRENASPPAAIQTVTESSVKNVQLEEDEILRVLRGCLQEERPDGLYFAPDIPSQKLTNARSSCGIPEDEHIVCLIDSTFWGSAKTALLFGRKGIYFQNGWSLDGRLSGGGMVPFSTFPNQTFKKGDWPTVALDSGKPFVNSSSVPTEKIVKMLNALKQLIDEKTGGTATKAS